MPKNTKNAPTPEMTALLKQTGSPNRAEARKAMRALAAALSVPLKQGILSGDIYSDIFTPEPLDPGATAEYPLDFFQPGMEGQYVAYTMPTEGTVPTRHIGGDVVTVQTYDIASSIDWLLKYSRGARWNIVARAMEVLEAGFTRKLNTDAWRVILAASLNRATLVQDTVADAGVFTKRLVSLMKTAMRRTTGNGNTASGNRNKLTDLFISPEALEDIRNWDLDDIDDVTRREILVADDGSMSRLYGVNLHDIDELGEGQEFNNYYTGTGGLNQSLANSDKEIVVGFDLTKNDSFVMPIKEELTVFDDPALHRRRRQGVYAWQEQGLACLDWRRVIAGSL